MNIEFKWYWRIFPWLMFNYMKQKSEEYVIQQKAIAQKTVEEADRKLIELRKGNFLVQPESETEFAFEVKGIRYFKFVDELKMPAARSLDAIDAWTALQEKADKDYHMLAYQAIYDQAVKGNLVNVGNIATNALVRMKHISNADIMLQLASILYFDEQENPYEYNTEYAEKKIALWREEGLESFFSRTPLREYLPSFGTSNMNFQTYTEIQRKELAHQLQLHLSMLSSDPKNNDIKTSTLSQVKKLNQLML